MDGHPPDKTIGEYNFCTHPTGIGLLLYIQPKTIVIFYDRPKPCYQIFDLMSKFLKICFLVETAGINIIQHFNFET